MQANLTGDRASDLDGFCVKGKSVRNRSVNKSLDMSGNDQKIFSIHDNLAKVTSNTNHLSRVNLNSAYLHNRIKISPITNQSIEKSINKRKAQEAASRSMMQDNYDTNKSMTNPTETDLILKYVDKESFMTQENEKSAFTTKGDIPDSRDDPPKIVYLDKIKDLLVNVNIEKLINDKETMEYLSKTHYIPKDPNFRGGSNLLKLRLMNKRDSEIAGLIDSSRKKDNKAAYNNEHKVMAENPKSGRLIKQYQMYLADNTKNVKPAYNDNTGAGKTRVSRSSNQSTRANSCTRTYHKPPSALELRDTDTEALNLNTTVQNTSESRKKSIERPRYLSSLNRSPNQRQPISSAGHTTPTKNNLNIYGRIQASINKADMVQKVDERNNDGEKSNCRQSNLLRPSTGLKSFNREIPADSYPKKISPKKIPPFSTNDSPVSKSDNQRKPRLVRDDSSMDSNKLIRSLYRIKSSSRSLDVKSEGDISQPDGSRYYRPSTQPAFYSDKNQNMSTGLKEKTVENHKHRPSSTQIDRAKINLNTPSYSRNARTREESTLGLTYTSHFSARTSKNTTIMQKFKKDWEDSKKKIMEGKLNDASFLRFEMPGSVVHPRTKATVFGMEGRKPLFPSTERSPGPGKYLVQKQSKNVAFSFGKERKFDIADLPVVEEINKKLDPIRYMYKS